MGFNSIMQFFQPKSKVFFDLFEKMADTMEQTSEIFLEGIKNHSEKRFEILAQTKELEHKADQLTHGIYVELNSNFITPFDREDIHALASELDDIVDYLDEAGHKMKSYEFNDYNDYFYKIAESNNNSIKELKHAIYELRNMKNMSKVTESCLRVHGYESEVDLLYNEALGELVRKHKNDATYVIILKDLLEELELISDKCQDASNVIEAIVIKYS
jgi:uncharacterized protein